MNENSIKHLNNLFIKFPNLFRLEKTIIDTINLLKKVYYSDGKILVCGNGGSASDAEHIVGELMKSFVLKRKVRTDVIDSLRFNFPDDVEEFVHNIQEPIPAISLVSQSSLLTAFSNDSSFDFVFAQQVYGYGKSNDVLISISTSGNSKNVVNASKIAKILKIPVISFTGLDSGKLGSLSTLLLNVPSKLTSDIQEYHLPLYHTICLAVEEELFGDTHK